ncbi:type I pullulanase [Poriferisphaera sp. WC338]|uniref:type I pullulanase n=1 Tax=Poriferisphaera sp. WC338 TaxID=3425129 RepID=UPI003D8154E9
MKVSSNDVRVLWLLALMVLMPFSLVEARGLSAVTPNLAKVKPAAPESVKSGSLLVLHYYRPDGNYRGWNVWAWQDGKEGKSYPLSSKDHFGAYAKIKMSNRTDKINFIIRLNNWEHKDVDHDRSTAIGSAGVSEVWLVSEDANIYTKPSAIDFSLKIKNAFLDQLGRISLNLSQPINSKEVKPSEVVVRVGSEAREVRGIQTKSSTTKQLDVVLAKPLSGSDLSRPITVELPGYAPAIVYARDALDQVTALGAKLGAYADSQSTTFRTWSPVASEVDLLLFDIADVVEPSRTIALEPQEDGVWQVNVGGDLHGTYYQYRFKSYGESRIVADIHCFAAAPDSSKSMVVDLGRTDPAGWDAHEVPKSASQVDEVIYEVHVRDFSVTDQSVPVEQRGKFLGMTHLSTEGKVSTSLSHLKELGVTAVHLLPIQDYTASLTEYNWGYWTALFNVPEAQYSTKPHQPAETIRELKQTIKILHENNIRVILDVVYNHTSSSFGYSPFDQAVPWYFFRTTSDGQLCNESGCGNAFADERLMARKYMIDSLRYWAEEYKVDGFRFDLIGMHYPETIKQVAKELRAVRPDLTIYGEPWTGGGPTHFGKGVQKNTTVAVFNDNIRNAIRGDLDGKQTGFATGDGGDYESIKRGVMGAINDFTASPTETVNYVSAHDNRTFWDKLNYTHTSLNERTKRSMLKLAQGIVLTSQGIPFLHGGSDFARTKGGNHNSYNAGDGVNHFDWKRKQHYKDVNRYIRGLIAMRKAHPAFRMRDAAAVRQNLNYIDTHSASIGYVLNGKAVGDTWGTIFVAYNGEGVRTNVTLPSGKWSVVVNEASAGNETLRQVQGKAVLPPYSVFVAYQND